MNKKKNLKELYASDPSFRVRVQSVLKLWETIKKIERTIGISEATIAGREGLRILLDDINKARTEMNP